MPFTSHYNSPLGGLTLASDGEALVGLWFDGQKHFPNSLSADHSTTALPVFQETCRWLNVYFSGQIPDFTPKLNPQGTPFRKAVWNLLLEIPYGKTTTYGELAKRLARTRNVATISAQAVGGAVGHNPVSLIVPCHRVIGTDGSLVGYAGGLDRKQWLLQLEAATIAASSNQGSSQKQIQP